MHPNARRIETFYRALATRDADAMAVCYHPQIHFTDEVFFDFWRWSRQALGLPGLLLGWSGHLRERVARTAARSLERYMAPAAGDHPQRSR